MYCQNCGTEFAEDDQFCGNCGAERPGVTPPASEGQQPPTPQPPPAASRPPLGHSGADQTPPRRQPQAPAPPAAGGQRPGRGFTIAAFVAAAIALIYFPIIFGPVGAILGWQGKKRGDPLGQTAMWVAIGAALAGFVIAFVVLAAS